MQAAFSLSLALCLTLALLHCGHWKPIEIALQLSLIKLQLCHKPHMKSTRGEAGRGEARRAEVGLVESSVSVSSKELSSWTNDHTAYAGEER